MDRKALDDARHDFIDRHGGIKAARRGSPTDEYFLFPDGSRLASDPLAENLPPPKDKVERLKLILAYRKIILRECKDEFEQFRNLMLFHFDREHARDGVYPNYDGTQEEGLEELRNKRNAIWNAQFAMEQVQQQLDAILKPAEKAEHDAAIDRQIAEQHSKFMDEFQKITT